MKPADIVSAEEITDCDVKLILEKVLITYADTNRWSNDCVELCIILCILYNVCVCVCMGVCVCVCVCVHESMCVRGWGELIDEVLVYMFITSQNVLAEGWGWALFIKG